jgi:hypothetical protein
MGVSTPVDITPEIEAAFRRFAITPRRIVLISPLRERKRARLSYRVETEDGRTVKVRQLDSIERARFLVDLRAGLEESFAPVLAHHGPVLLEEWIEGVPLTGLDGEARAEEAGALLGRLHGMPLRLDAPSTFSTRRWNEAAESDMRILSNAGKLAPAEIASLRAGILRRDPGTARAAVIHKDFCAENMLIDAGGRLRSQGRHLRRVPGGLQAPRGSPRDAWRQPLLVRRGPEPFSEPLL